MCFSAKVKTPKVDTNQVKAAEPAPLTAQPSAVLFGGDDEENQSGTSSEVATSSGRKAVKVDNDVTPKSGGIKASIRSKATNK